MTIAAGFVCDTGAVLCADTQETIPGYTKTDSKKLLPFSCPGFNLVFAGSGNNATQIDEVAYEVAAKMNEKAPRTATEFRRDLRESLHDLFPKAHYPRSGGPEVDMLMAVKRKNDVGLYRIADCNFAPVPHKAAVGTGVILALQLLQRHYDYKVQINEAAIICIYVLHHVKKWVDGCGGNTELVLVPKAGDTIAFMPSTEVDKFEKYSQAYDEALKGLLLAAPRTPKNKSLFKQYVDAAESGLYAARAMFQEFEDTMRELCEQMGTSYEEMMRAGEEASAAFFAAGETNISAVQESERS